MQLRIYSDDMEIRAQKKKIVDFFRIESLFKF